MALDVAGIAGRMTATEENLEHQETRGEPDRRDPATEGQILTEVALASMGYTVSVRKTAVLSQFRGVYFLRRSEHKLDLLVSETSFERLADVWRHFRHLALCQETPGAIEEFSTLEAVQAVGPLVAKVPPNLVEETAPSAGLVVPIGGPSQKAMQIATGATGQRYALRETVLHPAVQLASMELAYTLMAYGLGFTTRATQQGAGETPRHDAERPDKPNQRHVLLVDDVDDVLVSVGAFLVKEGYAVQKAVSSDEALRRIASDPRIEVLVTDFAMPGLNGGELIALAAQLRPNLKALVITGYPNADGLADLPPNTSVLVKPFRRNALIAGVKALLAPVSREAVELRETERLQKSDRQHAR
jgi:CheY-like chemotaxis protein